MRIVIEEYQYDVANIKNLLYGIDALENVEGKVSVHYVGYFYNTLLKDCVFILPKVLLKDVEGQELVFGKYKPESIANLDETNPLDAVERNFLYKFAVWVYRAIVVYKNDKRNDTDIVYHSQIAQVGNGQRRLSNTYLDILLSLLQFLKDGKNILLEGQLGTLKDPDFGIYPMVTSSSTLAGYGCVGAGIPPHEVKDIVVVTKAYSSAVGAGEFVSEIFGDEAQELRIHGGDKGEFGATTGRPRRVGWFDCVASRYGIECQGATQVAMTALDCLSYLEEIKVCTAYEIDGEITKDFPTTSQLKKAKPVFETLKGWHCDIRGIKEFDKLPKEAQDYVLFIEKQIGHKINMVSNGAEREAIIYRD